MQRRTLLRLGIASAAVVAVGGGALSLIGPGLADGKLSPSSRLVFRRVAEAVLQGTLPDEPAARTAALDAQLQRLDAVIAAFPPATQAELSQLLALLAAAPGRVLLAGVPRSWPEASVADVQQGLQAMRTSPLALRQQAYHALRDLTNAAWYAEPAAWAQLGYPGPIQL